MKESHQCHQPLIYMAPRHPLTQQFEDLYRLLHGEPLAADAALTAQE